MLPVAHWTTRYGRVRAGVFSVAIGWLMAILVRVVEVETGGPSSSARAIVP